MEEAKTPEMWLKRFYAEIEPEKRRKYLEKLFESGYDNEACQKLRQLWDFRYKDSKQGVLDRFMGAWLELIYVSKNTKTLLRTKNNKKLIQKALNDLCLSGETYFPEKMLYEELKNFLLCYITVSLEDFKQRVMGIKIRTKQGAIIRRIEESINEVATSLPQKYGLEKEFSLLTRVANDALIEYLETDEA